MHEVIYLNTTREGYSPDQIKHTMTVGDLISILRRFDEDTEIFFKNDDGYTYGGLKWGETIESEEVEDEDDWVDDGNEEILELEE